MSGYTAERGMLDDEPLVELLGDDGRRVRIACHGAALLSFAVPRGGALFDVASGYRDAAAIRARRGSHFAIMVPFAGRVGDARYRFDGREYDLQPGVEGAARGIMHGFVRDADFAVAELVADSASASATLATSAIRPRPGYPFAIDLEVRFTLAAGGLALTATMHNVGEHPAPCFFGWHPYFRVGDGKVDEWSLEIPADTLLHTDARLIPLAGTAAFVPLAKAPAFDFRRGRLIADSVLDNGYVDLEPDPDDRIRSRIANPADGFSVAMWQEHGATHVFTGDTLKQGARTAVAIEPMECMVDAFNRPEWAEAIRLEPGAERVFRCGIQVAGC